LDIGGKKREFVNDSFIYVSEGMGEIMNNIELRKKVHAAMYSLIKKNGVASPVEVLLEIGVLTKEKYEDWRFGRVAYLERVCQINLSKLSTINHEICVFARKNDLKPSWTDYRKHGKGARNRLRFSKSGDEKIERHYATQYISQRTAEEAKKRRESRESEENPILEYTDNRLYDDGNS
jgi:hypothetical protein